MILGKVPRVRLAHLPTPLEEMSRLKEAMKIEPDLYIKRDDNTGLATGGNKARKLEFSLALALRQGADVVITTGGIQSNHARMTAAAARKLGLECVLVLRGEEPSCKQGNLLLDSLLGARIRYVAAEDADAVEQEMERVAMELSAAGKKPYILPMGGSTPAGALGYANAFLELLGQTVEMGLNLTHLFLACGSGGTQAGLVLASRLAAPQVKVVGISVFRSAQEMKERIAELVGGAARYLDLELEVSPEEILVDDGYIGEGYGIPTEEGLEAIRLLARTEGILLDPVYTSKAMAGMLDWIKKGKLKRDDVAVFIHTGGVPALFAQSDTIAQL